MPPAVQGLIIANVLAFLLESSAGPGLIDALALWVDPAAPLAGVLIAPWQLVTYSFLHGSVAHLALNMLGLWMFGADVERVWGTPRLLLAYFAAVLTGALAQVLAAALFGAAGPVIGASGGVFGLMLAYGLLFPHRRVMLLIPPIPMSARTMVIAYAAVELVFGITGTAAGVAHFAHLGGLLGGWLAYRYGWRLARGRWR
jgi:membrane associated rhomboid family serine protease